MTAPTTREPEPAIATIRKAEPADLARIGGVLSAAFFDDPVFRWLTPDDARRRSQLPSFFALFAGAMIPHGTTFVAGDTNGAALWAPPGVPAVPESQSERFTADVLTLYDREAERLAEIIEILDANHPADDLYFLQFMGVAPDAQGRGYGSAMLHEVLQRADAERMPAYLEATSVHNKRLYERHGFVATAEIAPVGGPSLWTMQREPRG